MNNNSTIPDHIIVRSFRAEDRDDLRRISCQTAFLGLPLALFINDETIVADALTRYYTDFEPESCFVATVNNKVVGYIIGSTNIKIANRIFMQKIISPILWRAFTKGIFLQKNTLKFLFSVLMSVLKGEFRDPSFLCDYPATLHINIDKSFHRLHIGSQLIARYVAYLEKNDVPGVHFGTISPGAKKFFTKSGFTLLHQGRRSYLRYVTNETANYYIFGKKLT